MDECQVGRLVERQVWDRVVNQVDLGIMIQVQDRVEDQVWVHVGEVKGEIWDYVREQVRRKRVWEQISGWVREQVRDQLQR